MRRAPAAATFAPRMGWIVAGRIAAALVLVGGCGESGQIYSAGPTRECLERGGLRVQVNDARAAGGALNLEIPVGEATINVGFAESSARARGYAGFELGEGRSTERRGNVVVSSELPADRFLPILDCLRR